MPTRRDFDFDALSDHARAALEQRPDLRDNIEWLQRTCDETSPDADRHEVLLALLTLVENALAGASILIGPRLWDALNGCLQQIRHNGGESADRQRIVELIDGFQLLPQVAPVLAVNNASPTKSARRLTRAMSDARRALEVESEAVATTASEAKQSIKEAADQRRQEVEEAAGGYQQTMGEAAQRVERAAQEAEGAGQDAQRQISGAIDKANERLVELEKRYGFVAGGVLGGAHEAAAGAELSLAEEHTKHAKWAKWAAAAWSATTQLLVVLMRIFDWGPSGLEGIAVAVPLIGGPAGILIYVAASETRTANTHRRNHARLQSLELQFKSLRPYIADLTSGPAPPVGGDNGLRDKLIGDISPKLFIGDVGPDEPPPERRARRVGRSKD